MTAGMKLEKVTIGRFPKDPREDDWETEQDGAWELSVTRVGPGCRSGSSGTFHTFDEALAEARRQVDSPEDYPPRTP